VLGPKETQAATAGLKAAAADALHLGLAERAAEEEAMEAARLPADGHTASKRPAWAPPLDAETAAKAAKAQPVEGTATPAAAALPAASSARAASCEVVSSSTLPPPAVATADMHSNFVGLLQWIRDVSDHVIRPGRPGSFNEYFPGSLVTSWRPEGYKYKHPFSYVWAYDKQEHDKRSADQQLPSWQKTVPLLPMLTFGVPGDGDCLCHAALLADPRVLKFINPAEEDDDQELKDTDRAAGVHAAILQAPRDPEFGIVLPGGREAVVNALQTYRALSVNTCTHDPLAAQFDQLLTYVCCNCMFQLAHCDCRAGQADVQDAARAAAETLMVTGCG
jgi:hypothetical protein